MKGDKKGHLSSNRGVAPDRRMAKIATVLIRVGLAVALALSLLAAPLSLLHRTGGECMSATVSRDRCQRSPGSAIMAPDSRDERKI